MGISLNIRKSYGNFILDMELHSESRRIGILGASGCGKSLTLKSIAGIERPDSGKIEVDGKALYDNGRKTCLKPQERKVGYLFQNYALFPTMTVEKNIAIGIKKSKDEKAKLVKQMVRKFQLSGLEKQYPGELSGGQQQRAALARIMASEPDMILLDEPFSALDVFLKDRLQQEMIGMLEDYPGIVILVSHSRDEIYHFSDELFVVDQGRAICGGKTKDIFRDPEKKEAARITGCKNIVDASLGNDNRLKIPDWEISISLCQTISREVCAVGYRAHDFVPIWGEKKESCIPVQFHSVALLPFERKYFLKTKGEDLCWFVQRELWETLDEKGLPDYLQIKEEALLLLN